MKSLVLLSIILFSSAGAQWEHVPEVPANRVVYSLLAVHDTIYAGTDSVVYVGAKDGTQWSAGSSPFSTPDVVACMLKAGAVLLAGTFQNGVFRSTNDGASWLPFSTGLSGLGATDISKLLLRRDTLIAGTLGEGVFATASDFSRPWAPWGDSLTDYEGENVFKMAIAGTTVLANAGGNGYIFRYTDDRPWWDPIPINRPHRLIGQGVTGFASGASAVVAGTNAGIYRSTDEGLSWEFAAAPLPAQTIRILPVSRGPDFFSLALTPTSSALLQSTDNGATWQSLGEFPMPNVFDIATVGDSVYLGEPDGLWRAPLSQLVTAVGKNPVAISGFRLEQNYPNPFNPGTVISYQLPVMSEVSLSVYDVLGRKIVTLVNGRETAGPHEVIWNASSFPSGVYFYRLQFRQINSGQAGTYSGTKKMILLK